MDEERDSISYQQCPICRGVGPHASVYDPYLLPTLLSASPLYDLHLRPPAFLDKSDPGYQYFTHRTHALHYQHIMLRVHLLKKIFLDNYLLLFLSCVIYVTQEKRL